MLKYDIINKVIFNMEKIKISKIKKLDDESLKIISERMIVHRILEKNQLQTA